MWDCRMRRIPTFSENMTPVMGDFWERGSRGRPLKEVLVSKYEAAKERQISLVLGGGHLQTLNLNKSEREMFF